MLVLNTFRYVGTLENFYCAILQTETYCNCTNCCSVLKFVIFAVSINAGT